MRILRQWYVAIALLVAVLLDGIIAYRLQGFIFQGQFGASCWFSVVGISLIGLIDDRNVNNLWLCFGIGILADLYYYGFLGVYTVSFPLLCFLAQKSARILPEVFWTRLIATLVGYALMEIYLFIVFSIAGTISLPISSLLWSFLPGWGMCLVIFLITYRFWVKLVEKHPFLVIQHRYFF